MKPFVDQPQDVFIHDPFAKHLGQLLPHDAPKVILDVRFQNIAHLAEDDPLLDGLNRLVGVLARAIPVGAGQEILLIDPAENVGRRSLDDFIFQRGDRKRALFSVRLRDIHPSKRLGAIPSIPQTLMEVTGVLREPLAVVAGRHAIDARRRVFP